MTIMDKRAAYLWLRNNTSLENDTFLLDFEQLAYSIDKGWIKKIADTDLYVPGTFENMWGTYEVNEVYRVAEAVIRENLLIYPYRLKATLVKPSKNYKNLEPTVRTKLENVDIAITELPDYSIINEYYKKQKHVTVC